MENIKVEYFDKNNTGVAVDEFKPDASLRLVIMDVELTMLRNDYAHAVISDGISEIFVSI